MRDESIGCSCGLCLCRAEEVNVHDVLTAQGAAVDLPEECRSTWTRSSCCWGKKKKIFDDDDWGRSLTEAEANTAGVPEGQGTHAAPDGTSHNQAVDPKKVRPTQMVDIVRKYMSRRLLALSEHAIAALMRVCTQGGAEALAMLHQLIFDVWISVSLDTPFARIKADEQLIEWNVARNSASSLLPRHVGVAGWKHRALSFNGE